MEKEQIRLIREDMGMSQEAFAKYLGVSTNTVRNWETGRSTVPQTRLPALEALEARRAPSISQSNNKGTTIGTQTSGTGALRLLQAQLKEKDGQIEKLHAMIAELIKLIATK